jgi:hypothetical protein
VEQQLGDALARWDAHTAAPDRLDELDNLT